MIHLGRRNTVSGTLYVLGGVTVGFSLVMGAVVLFALSSVCSFVSGLQLIFLGFLFIIGILALAVGTVLRWREGRLPPNSKRWS